MSGLVAAGARLQNQFPVLAAQDGVEHALGLEAAEHVLGEDLGPHIAVVAGVISHEVAEAGLRVGALAHGEHGNGLHQAPVFLGGVDDLGRVIAQVDAGKEELAQVDEAGVDVLGGQHLVQKLGGSFLEGSEKCPDRELRMSFCQAHFSSICEGPPRSRGPRLSPRSARSAPWSRSGA